VLTVLLRARDFRLLWAGQSVSTVGDALVLVAVGIYVTRLTGDPSDVGLVLGAYSLPVVVFVLLGGVVADRLPRQQVMIASDLVRCALHVLLALLILTGAVQIWHMVVIGALFGTAEAFFRPAYTGLVPQTVDESDIQSAQALSGVSQEVASIIGPALATALVIGVGGAAAFAADAATFAVSAVLLSRIRTRERGERGQSASVLVELLEGWVAVRERAWVWATVLAFSFVLLVALTPFFVLGAAIAQEVYGTDAVYGFANAAWGVGTVSGAVLGSRWKPLRPMRAAVWGAVPWPLVLTVFALGPPVALTYALMALGGVGIGLFSVWWSTALAQRIPPHLLSRVSAWDYMGSLAFVPVGYLLAGPAAAAFGAVEVMAVGGVLGTGIMLLALIPRSTRQLERYESPSSPAAEAPASPAALGAAVVAAGVP
jgi:MFS family permease